MSQTFKLTYFDLTARGELARLLFTVAGQEFEDKRIQFSDWPALKATGAAPFGTLPFLEVTNADGSCFKIGQSMSIARYLASKFNLAGKNEQEKAECDAYLEVLNDTMAETVKVKFAPEAAKPALATKFADEILPANLSFLESKLAKTGTSFFVGDSLTAVDLYAASFFDMLFSFGVATESVLEKYPLFLAHRNMVKANPAVSAWNKAHNQ